MIFYDAVLNENAEIGLPGNENSAYLEFSNNPNGEGTGRTEEDTVIVFTYELDGTKVDGETQAALQNAQFVLLNGAKSEAAVVVGGKVTEWVSLEHKQMENWKTPQLMKGGQHWQETQWLDPHF